MSNKQIGKRYWRRDGGLTLPLQNSSKAAWPLRDPMTGNIYRSSGRYSEPKSDHPCDLLDEYVEPNEKPEEQMTEKQVGKRYRLLVLGEKTKKGDEHYLFPNWFLLTPSFVGRTIKQESVPVRRPMSEPSPLTGAEREFLEICLKLNNYGLKKGLGVIKMRERRNELGEQIRKIRQEQSTTVSVQEARESGGAVFVVLNGLWHIHHIERLLSDEPFDRAYLLPDEFQLLNPMPTDHGALIALGCKRVRTEEG